MSTLYFWSSWCFSSTRKISHSFKNKKIPKWPQIVVLQYMSTVAEHFWSTIQQEPKMVQHCPLVVWNTYLTLQEVVMSYSCYLWTIHPVSKAQHSLAERWDTPSWSHSSQTNLHLWFLTGIWILGFTTVEGRKTDVYTGRIYSCEPKLLQHNRSGSCTYHTIFCFPICHRQISFQSPLAEGRDVYSKVQLYFFCKSTSNKP